VACFSLSRGWVMAHLRLLAPRPRGSLVLPHTGAAAAAASARVRPRVEVDVADGHGVAEEERGAVRKPLHHLARHLRQWGSLKFNGVSVGVV
jgi:hypothetical protein